MKRYLALSLTITLFLAFASICHAAGDATVVKDFKIRAIEGLLPNSTVEHVRANELTRTTAYVAYPWAEQAAYPWPASAATMEVASTSATDTGAAVVTVHYLDSNWDAAEEDVTLTGQTEVAMSEPAIRVNKLVMKTPAAGQTSNVGVIYCANGATFSSGVPDTGILAVIRAGEGKSSGGFFSVPRNKNAVIDEMYVNFPAASTLETKLYARGFGGPFVIRDSVIVEAQSFVGNCYDLLAEKSDCFATIAGEAENEIAYLRLIYHLKED
jgi:hypothetical protein